MRNLNWICCYQCVFIRVHFAQTYKQCQKYQPDDRWPQRKMEVTSVSAPSPPGGGLKHNSQTPRRGTRKLTVIKNVKSWNLISFCCACVFISLFINTHFINQVNLALTRKKSSDFHSHMCMTVKRCCMLYHNKWSTSYPFNSLRLKGC